MNGIVGKVVLVISITVGGALFYLKTDGPNDRYVGARGTKIVIWDGVVQEVVSGELIESGRIFRDSADGAYHFPLDAGGRRSVRSVLTWRGFTSVDERGLMLQRDWSYLPGYFSWK